MTCRDTTRTIRHVKHRQFEFPDAIAVRDGVQAPRKIGATNALALAALGIFSFFAGIVILDATGLLALGMLVAAIGFMLVLVAAVIGICLLVPARRS